jgi:hypothetical protein
MVLTKDAVHWAGASESHEDIIRHAGLRDEALPPDILRVEIVPPNGDMRRPLDEWEYVVDQDVMPAWYVREVDEPRARAALPTWCAACVIAGGDHVSPSPTTRYVVGGTVQAVSGGVVRAVYGGVVRAVSDGGVVQAVSGGGVVRAVYGGGVVRAVSGGGVVRAVSDGGVVQAVSDGVVRAVYGGGVVQAVYGGGVVQAVSGGGTVITYARGGVVCIEGSGVVVDRSYSPPRCYVGALPAEGDNA